MEVLESWKLHLLASLALFAVIHCQYAVIKFLKRAIASCRIYFSNVYTIKNLPSNPLTQKCDTQKMADTNTILLEDQLMFEIIHHFPICQKVTGQWPLLTVASKALLLT